MMSQRGKTPYIIRSRDYCHAMMIKGMVFRYTSTHGFIPKKIQWHIHTGSWSLVNCLAGSLYEAFYKVLMNIN